MRVAPVGLFSAETDEKKVFKIAVRSGAVTHGHVTAGLAAGAMALLIKKLIGGLGLPEAVTDSLAMLSKYPGHEETTTALQKAVKAARKDNPDHESVINTLWGDPRNEEKNSLGWIAEEALAIGVYAALKGNNYCEVIRIAANHSGDTDSTASVAGQLYGAWHGTDGIPHKWISRLDVFADIIQCASACY
jgi:ADP-ribosylglycohydrolase